MKNIALITGAAGGIGREFAKIHASHGGDLVAVDLNLEGLEELKLELSLSHPQCQIHLIQSNLSEADSTAKIYQELKEAKIDIDILINNAGFGGLGMFHERNWHADENMIKVNVLALASLSRYFLPDFVARGAGKILNVSSTVSLIPGPMQAVYFASKAFVTSFSHSLAGELEGTGVSVTALLPGATQTGFGAQSGMDKTKIYRQPASPKDVALVGYHAMMAGKLQVIAGLPWTQRLSLAISPLIPKRILLSRIKKQQVPS